MRVYICGAISRYKGQFDRIRDEFQIIEDILSSRGVEVCNPWKILPYSPEYTWVDYMRKDISALCTCDAVIVRKDWMLSKGARFEVLIAKILGLPIYPEKQVYELKNLLDSNRII